MIRMKHRVAIVGAGVSGLTCGIVLAERGYRTAIFAKEIGQQTTSGAAAAVLFSYHPAPAKKALPLGPATPTAAPVFVRIPAYGASTYEHRHILTHRPLTIH